MGPGEDTRLTTDFVGEDAGESVGPKGDDGGRGEAKPDRRTMLRLGVSSLIGGNLGGLNDCISMCEIRVKTQM